LEAHQVEKVLHHCDRRRKMGKRDHAILLLLARLGLRASEVMKLQLEDIDWGTGQLLIHGKGSRVDRLPLVRDVGQALADYLQKERPVCSSRQVFIQSHAPYGPISCAHSIGDVVERALARAQLKPCHREAHLLRHSLATRMIRTGASLAQIGQVLRHQHSRSTELYAKVDLAALRALAQPWPRGAQ
jgi:site-specific recombinase XerD